MLTRGSGAAVVSAGLLILLAMLALIIAQQFIWQPSPVYRFLLLVSENYIAVLIISYLIILFFILYRYWGKTAGYIEEIVEASEKLISPNEELIRLSPVLQQVEDRMNQIKQIAIKNERAARDELQRKNDLIVYLAHDIKTPLTSVIGYLSLLDEAPDMPPEQKAKYVGITLEKANRLDQLIDEFFEITRFNLQHIEVNMARINLSLMLRQMADEFYPMLTPQNKKADVDAPESLIIWGDADKLSRVFNNILKNAIAYSYDNATISIKAFCQEANTVITFANQGDTIPAEKLERIFEKFFRLDTARSSHTGGAGLGLAIAKEIVAAHGGTIAATSDENNTVFTVVLPHAIGQSSPNSSAKK
jgi:two-component system sensor histidine kinase VanS